MLGYGMMMARYGHRTVRTVYRSYFPLIRKRLYIEDIRARGQTRHGTARHGTARHGTARHGTARHGTARHGTARHGTARHGTARHGTARHGTARHGTARHGTARHGTARHGTDSFEILKHHSLGMARPSHQDITPEGDHTTRDDEGQDRPPLSPGQTSLDKAREILASKLIKGAKSHDDEERDVEEDDIPKINYGTVSFGNRYSLVSSDCISISSESSLSSFTNSLNDLLDRMGLASKNETAKDLKISGGADEGIFSDERYSPSKSCDKDSEPSPSRELEIQQHTKTVNGDAYEKTTPNKPPFHDDSFNYLESLMDAPSSPYAKKRSPKSQVKDEESESESTDASSDDRDRRYSCEEFFSPNRPSSPQEDKAKRHSFDIADLSANYNRAKKKGRRNRRFNQIIIFDNFVASPLKPGKFGSLRKSFERLSKIQEVTEELGLLSNESLKDIPEPQFGDPSSLGNQAVQNIAEKPRFHDVCLATADH
ncbi:hypothetical protein QZH41_010654, partial [Actinostola sp. cb2023]